MAFLDKHKVIETHATLLLILSFLVVTIGGLVQIVPLFYLENTIEEVEGVRPYTPLELAGRNIYIREGCYVCHSQMIRPMRDEVERYGHYSLAAESMYDHPFQWGSKRTGPDLARVGERYSDDWHVDHLTDPQSVVPESVMPKYGFLLDREIDGRRIGDEMQVHRMLGTPYTDDMLQNAVADFRAQADPNADYDGMVERYKTAMLPTDPERQSDRDPLIAVRNFDGQPQLTEMDALIAYLQVLGTMVDFSTFQPDPNR
ncbi:cytochrome-c oxidase, cbb3-type subunit II [Cereibacter changlensis]|uniref:cytochrome-c oxidase, cbb3-type subunit II n=1 Tax=Cereibacter changlensis TaxID=402884 RepID=UPI0040334078